MGNIKITPDFKKLFKADEALTHKKRTWESFKSSKDYNGEIDPFEQEQYIDEKRYMTLCKLAKEYSTESIIDDLAWIVLNTDSASGHPGWIQKVLDGQKREEALPLYKLDKIFNQRFEKEYSLSLKAEINGKTIRITSTTFLNKIIKKGLEHYKKVFGTNYEPFIKWAKSKRVTSLLKKYQKRRAKIIDTYLEQNTNLNSQNRCRIIGVCFQLADLAFTHFNEYPFDPKTELTKEVRKLFDKTSNHPF